MICDILDEFKYTATIHSDIFCISLCPSDMSDIYVKRIRPQLSMLRVWGTFRGFITGPFDDNEAIKGAILKEK